jgi:hypothetical protein
VIADIAAQYAAREDTREKHDSRPGRRFPTEGLRRHTQQRDHTCKGPGCRRPASQCEHDHTTDFQHCGPTTSSNGDPLCKWDHKLKSEGGWRLEQPEPGLFIWYTPFGQIFRTRGSPIIYPPPENGDTDDTDDGADDEPPPF